MRLPRKYLLQSVFWSSITSSVTWRPDTDDVTRVALDTAAPNIEAPWSRACPVSDWTRCRRDSRDFAGELGALVVFEPGLRFNDKSLAVLDWDGGGGGGACNRTVCYNVVLWNIHWLGIDRRWNAAGWARFWREAMCNEEKSVCSLGNG